LKIITWNCNGALRKKLKHLSNFDADLYIIQECENPAESRDKNYQEWAENYIWIGDTKNKGLAFFARQEVELIQLGWSNQYKNHIVQPQNRKKLCI
jgi:exonuclease III